jgi:hypothetical protein
VQVVYVDGVLVRNFANEGIRKFVVLYIGRLNTAATYTSQYLARKVRLSHTSDNGFFVLTNSKVGTVG